MKKIGVIVTIVLLVAVLSNISCQDSSREKLEKAKTDVAKADKNLDMAKEDYLADVEVYKKETKTKISANEKSIKEFKARIANSKEEAKADFDEKIKELEQKNTDMQRKMDEYKLEGKDRWDSFKSEFNHDMNELGTALKDLTNDNVK